MHIEFRMSVLSERFLLLLDVDFVELMRSLDNVVLFDRVQLSSIICRPPM